MNRRDVCQAGLYGEKIITKPGKQRLQNDILYQTVSDVSYYLAQPLPTRVID